MKILLSPQIRQDKIRYRFKDDVVEATYKGVTDTFDFRGMTDGVLQFFDDEDNELIETRLEVQPIIRAERQNGVLWVELLNVIDAKAEEHQKFPSWIDHTEYTIKG